MYVWFMSIVSSDRSSPRYHLPPLVKDGTQATFCIFHSALCRSVTGLLLRQMKATHKTHATQQNSTRLKQINELNTTHVPQHSSHNSRNSHNSDASTQNTQLSQLKATISCFELNLISFTHIGAYPHSLTSLLAPTEALYVMCATSSPVEGNIVKFLLRPTVWYKYNGKQLSTQLKNICSKTIFTCWSVPMFQDVLLYYAIQVFYVIHSILPKQDI